ncbi:hypothetical protein [Gelidibacter salicanalis]|nr:hypothetical protein [Gelidibacter salicanalis]
MTKKGNTSVMRKLVKEFHDFGLDQKRFAEVMASVKENFTVG